jgi:hypothetical protein
VTRANLNVMHRTEYTIKQPPQPKADTKDKKDKDK